MCSHCLQVLLELTRQADQEKTVLSLSVCQLGAEGKKRSFDLSVTSYLRRVSLDYCDDVAGNGGWSLVTSLLPLPSTRNKCSPDCRLSKRARNCPGIHLRPSRGGITLL